MEMENGIHWWLVIGRSLNYFYIQNKLLKESLNVLPMKIMMWNCRGDANPSFSRVAKDLIKVYHPTVLPIVESRIVEQKAYHVAQKLGYTCVLCVGSSGLSGGLWLL